MSTSTTSSLNNADELEEGTDDDKFKAKHGDPVCDRVKMSKTVRGRKRSPMPIRKRNLDKHRINVKEELVNGQDIAQNEKNTLIDLSRQQEGIANEVEEKESHNSSIADYADMQANSMFNLSGDAEVDSSTNSSKDGELEENDDVINWPDHVNSHLNQPPMKRRKPMRMPYSEPKDLTCQVCGNTLPNATELTVHIRQHNIPSNSNTHSCNMCGRILSSQSSLDRHMLVHSGERPFKCPICKMAFTTNGNMNRHLRTHEKENEIVPATSIFNVTVQTNGQRKRIPSKRLLECDEDYMPLKKKVVPKSPMKKAKPIISLPRETVEISLQTGDLNCPVCHKAFLCKYGVLTHMEMHPHMSLRCSICSAVFKNHRGLRMHIQMVHEKVMKQTASTVPVGFQDLACLHVDFSSNSFPRVAQKWCEENVRRSASSHIRFVCKDCNKAFPCRAALELHVSTHCGTVADIQQQQPCDIVLKTHDASKDQTQFLALFSLQPTSDNKKECKAKPFIGNPAPSPRKFTNVSNNYIQSSPRKKPLQWHNMSKDSMKVVSSNPKRGPAQIYPIRSMTLLTQPSMSKISPVKGSAISTSSVKPLPVLKMAPSPPSLKKIKVKIEQSKDEIQVMDLSPNMTASTGDEGSAMEPEDNPEEAGSERLVLSDPSADPKAANVDNKCLHTCKYCSKVFPFASTLKIHMRNHMGLTPYQCMLCTYASADKSTLVRHMRTHSGERPYSCAICEFPFTTKANCERHIRKKHHKDDKADIESCIIANESPKLAETNSFTAPESVCSICGRNFKFFRDLQNHMRVHEKCDDKPYICGRCPSGFASRSNCMRHIAKRHPEVPPEDVETVMIVQVPSKQISKSDPSTTDEQPLDFSMKADKPAMIALASTSQLLVNTESSDAHQQICAKLLIPHSSIGKLRFKRVYHKFYSRAVDALVCPHCTLAFSRSTLFKRHIRSHTAERPFRCYFCSAAFTVKENLDKHMLKRHNNIADGAQQSFIPKVATPMQHKLLSKTPSKRTLKPRVKPSTREWVDLNNSAKNEVAISFVQSFNPSSSASVESDTGEDLTSISKMLAATNTHNFQSLLEARLMNPPTIDSQQISCSVEEPEIDIKYQDKPVNEHPQPEYLISEKKNEVPTKRDDKKEGTEEDKKVRVRYKFVKKLSCPYCPRMFPWISSLRRHLLVHSGLKPYQCVNCTATFSTKSNCERHMVRKHNLTQDEATKLTTVNPFNCELCSQTSFNRIDLLEAHYEESHPGQPLPEYFSRAKEVMQVPLEELMSKIKPKSDGNLHKKETISGTCTDEMAGHKMSNELIQMGDGDLDELMQTTKSDETTDFQDEEIKYNNEHEDDINFVEMSEDSPARFDDETKAIEFDQEIGIDVHTDQVQMSNDEEEFEMKVMANETQVDDTQQVGKHKALHSSSLSNGRKHRRKISCTHVCKQCKKKFKNSATLRRHYRVHTLEHPFKCSICSSSFTTKFNCQRHMIKIHGKQREDVFKVMELSETEQNELIKEATSQISAASQDAEADVQDDADSIHSSNDTDHTSSEKSFSSLVSKTASSPGKQTTDDIRRKFSCDVCQKKFLSSRDLKRHDRTHTGERPFVCTDCNRNFGFKHSLVRHQRTHSHSNWTVQKSPDKFASAGCNEADVNSIQDHSQDINLSTVSTNEPSQVIQKAYDIECNLSSSQDIYIPSTLQDNSSMLMQEASGNDCDLFEDENLMSRINDSDIIQNLLGIQDSSMIDEMLDSADSAAKLLGVGET